MDVRQDWVVKSNNLINARYDWTVLQQRMILLMIAQLDTRVEDFGNQTIQVADLLEKGQVSGHAYYERAADAAHILLDQKIYVKQPNGRWRGYNLLSYVEPGPGYVIARFNPDMRPFLLQLKARFTKYMLENVMRFQSPYSTRIYELAMQYLGIGHRTIPLDALREMLALEDKYPRFYDFKRRVLDQAKKEINRHTDLNFRYDIIREGRSPVAVRFHMQKKSRQAKLPAGKGRGGQQVLDLDEGGDPDRAAFDARWTGQEPQEQERLRAESVKRLDPFVLRLYLDNPEGVAAQASLWEALREIYNEIYNEEQMLSAPSRSSP